MKLNKLKHDTAGTHGYSSTSRLNNCMVA